MATFILTFLCGAAYECCCVFWVHHSERGRVLPAVGFSMAAALVTAVGVEGFLKNWVFVLAYMLGYGTGTALGMQLRKRLGRRRRDLIN